MDGLYKDKKDQLWVVIHLEDEELLECGKTETSDYVPRQTKYSENREI